MKRLNRSEAFAERFPAATLYLDDIEVIISEFLEHGHEVTLKDDEYEFESLEEVAKVRGSRPPRLVIASKVELGPAFRFARWSKSGLTLRQGANSNDRILLARVAEILTRRRSWLCKFFVPSVLGALSAACFVALFIAADRYGSYLFFLSFGLLVLAGIASDIQTGFGSTLNLAHRHKTSPFLAKHAEKILYSASGALAGALATHLVQKLFK